MVTYEITATVDQALRESYESYMRERHIPDLMGTGAFVAATFSRSEPGRYRVRYEARSRQALDDYLAQHATAMRNHFAETFPYGIVLSREEWSVLQQWREPD